MKSIYVVKRPPAPVMDGFAVGHLKPGRVYEVTDGMANYLTVAGYAVPAPLSREPPKNAGKKDEPPA